MKCNVEKIVNENKCCGCFLCSNVCKFHAIIMKQSKEGFYVPQVDKEKCINCGECIKKCPINNTKMCEDENYINIFAGKSTNENIRKKSSSGGIFAEIAKRILHDEGIVIGAAFDKNNILKHTFVDEEKKLSILLGSKYIQSYVGRIYSKAENFLKQGKKVLFVGTPCQVYAINNFIEERKNLITVDLVCHGVPSLKIFNKYLYQYFKGKKIKNISFRDKSKDGWKNYSIKIEHDGLSYIKSHKKDLFFYGYLKNFYLNNICYECPFSKIPRVSDITLGDFWGFSSSIDDNLGISVIIANSLKGYNVLKDIHKNNNILLQSTTLEQAVKQNARIVQGTLFKPKERKKVFKNIDLLNFQNLADKYFEFPTNDKVKKAINNIKNKEIIIFGTGNIAIQLLNKFENIKYFLDNDKNKWGKTLRKIEIFAPNKVKNENKEDVFIVVASSYYNDIKEQLIRLGLKENTNFIDGNNYFL